MLDFMLYYYMLKLCLKLDFYDLFYLWFMHDFMVYYYMLKLCLTVNGE